MIYVGLKYCGGCMPAYDRTALVDRLRARLAGKAELVPWDHPDTVMTLVVSGCDTACADTGPFSAKPIFHLKGPAHINEENRLIALIDSHRLTLKNRLSISR